MSYYIRDGVDLKEVPLHKVETLMNAGITIISDKDIIKELKQQLEESVDVINWYAECQDVGVKARQFLAKYRGGK